MVLASPKTITAANKQTNYKLHFYRKCSEKVDCITTDAVSNLFFFIAALVKIKEEHDAAAEELQSTLQEFVEM